MATGSVVTAGEQQNDERKDDDESDDPEHFHPQRCARGWLGVASDRHFAFVRVSHVYVPLLDAMSLQDILSLADQDVSTIVAAYASVMPKLWTQTIEAHRREVRDAILERTAALVEEYGLRSVTMSQIAEQTGVGRATLYKYFSSVDAILVAWHEHQITRHLAYLAEVRDRAGAPADRLAAVLEAYALIAHEHHGTELAALLHRGEHVARAQKQLSDFIRDLLIEGAETGDLRDDFAPDELASYCLHALSAASSLPSKAAVRRLVIVILAGLQPGP
jgi:AcrR family transcriptional regulator